MPLVSLPWDPTSCLKHVDKPAYLIGRSCVAIHSSLWNAAIGCSEVAIKYFSSIDLSSLFSLPLPITYNGKLMEEIFRSFFCDCLVLFTWQITKFPTFRSKKKKITVIQGGQTYWILSKLKKKNSPQAPYAVCFVNQNTFINIFHVNMSNNKSVKDMCYQNFPSQWFGTYHFDWIKEVWPYSA